MKIPERVRELDFIIERIGVPLAAAIFLGWVVFFIVKKIDRKMSKMLRYEVAIMRAQRIPIPSAPEQEP